MRATVLVLPDGKTRMESPGAIRPAAIWPAKPRKSRSGRLTHCTGRRKGAAARRSASISTVSRCSIRVGPAYQGVAELREAILSPFRPEMGMARIFSTPSSAAKMA